MILTQLVQYREERLRSGIDQSLLALADPTRRAILARLSAGPMRVTDLARHFPVSLNSVSKHVRMLERARMVMRRRSGREHMLSANLSPVGEAASWIAAQHATWAARLGMLSDLLDAEDRAATSRRKRRQP
jgi:DNA-binding transcriptional ArsR family regulator